jgi:hypothetical protein
MTEFISGLITRFVLNLILMAIFKTNKMFIPHWIFTAVAGTFYFVDYDKYTGVVSMDTNETSLLMLGFISFDIVVYIGRSFIKKGK